MATAVGQGTGSTPGVTSLGELRRQVLAAVQQAQSSDPDLLAAAADGINAGVHSLNNTNWMRMLAYTDITSVSEQVDYTLPPNFRTARKLELLDSNGAQTGQLSQIDVHEIADLSPRLTSGHPYGYIIFHQNAQSAPTLSFDIKPSAGWVSIYPKFRLRYFRRIPQLNAEDQALQAPPEFARFLVMYARWDLLSTRGNIQDADRAYSEAQRLLNEMHMDNSNEFMDRS